MFITWIKLSKTGSVNTRSILLLQCDECHVQFQRRHSYNEVAKTNESYQGKDLCRRCCTIYVVRTPEYRSKMSKSQKLRFDRHPELKQHLSNKLKGVNLGDKNGMKRPENRKKVSNARKQMMTQEMRDTMSVNSRNAWAAGKFDGVKVGRCKWYDIKTPDGTIKVQGTWEKRYAMELLENNIPFTAHRGRIPYVDKNGIERSYYPDFYLINQQEYIDIKAPYFYHLNSDKFECIRMCNPIIKLTILTLKRSDDTWIPIV